MLIIHTIIVTPFMQNARILVDSETNQGVIVDPGGDSDRILTEFRKTGAVYKGIWLTHSHLDHCGGVKRIMEKLEGDLWGHPDEAMMRASVTMVAQMYGMPSDLLDDCPEPNHFISGGENIKLGNLEFNVLHTPGHSPGHLSFYCAKEKVVISGDVLFSGSIGRTDLPGGDHKTLIRIVREKLFTLPSDTKVLSGHGSDTTIGNELRTNPFFTATN